MPICRNTNLKNYKQDGIDPKDICVHFRSTGECVRAYCRHHNLPRTNLLNWLAKYELFMTHGIDEFYGSKGRPRKIDVKAIENLKHKLITASEQQHTANKRGFAQVCNEGAAETLKRRGIGCGESVVVSQRTMDRTIHEAKVSKGECQHKTKARIDAEADPRNAYSMYCMANAFTSDEHPEMMFNWDATQYVLGTEKGKVGYTVKTEDSAQKPLTAQSTGELEFGIKLYHMHNAAGAVAPPVYVVADKSMKEGEFVGYRVPGLGNANIPGSFGYVCFTQTRCCNDEFYRWFVKDVVVPFVESCRAADTDDQIEVSLKHFITQLP